MHISRRVQDTQDTRKIKHRLDLSQITWGKRETNLGSPCSQLLGPTTSARQTPAR
jgi:hypothetical protein